MQCQKPPIWLEERIEAFLEFLRESIAVMSPEDYSFHNSRLVLSLSEMPRFLGKESWYYYGCIENGRYDFKRRT
jgi:insulysin